MKLKRNAARTANSVLRRFGLELSRIALLDFEARLVSPKHLSIMFDDLAKPMEEWIHTQRLFQPRCSVPVRDAIENFYSKYLESPFHVQAGGSRFNNLLWLYLLSNAIQPSIIIDSGTYTGASAWALWLGSPQSPLTSFDIDQSRLRFKVPGVSYIEKDWTTFDLTGCDLSRALCYFDDHVDQIGRLIQAAERRIPWAVFDDDFRVTSYLPLSDVQITLPKVEFALDDRLSDKDVISWSYAGRTITWQVDRSYLDKGRATIHATERLPDTSLITGISQTPYRVVALKH